MSITTITNILLILSFIWMVQSAIRYAAASHPEQTIKVRRFFYLSLISTGLLTVLVITLVFI